MPVPVSSYATCVPVALKMRIVVAPVHDALANNAPQVLTVKVCPALAVTPHKAKLEASAFISLARIGPHRFVDVGAWLGTGVGAGVGTTDGEGLGAAVGNCVGNGDGLGEGADEGCCVGSCEGSGEGATVG